METIFRNDLRVTDRDKISSILESTNFFYDFEIKVALEIIDDHLSDRQTDEYHFIMVEEDGELAGYVNFGPVPCTQTSWDIYWIAVRKSSMNRGLGKKLIGLAEEFIRTHNGLNIWVETSGRPDYNPTRGFYLRSGYSIVSELTDFYAPGDNKVIFHKKLPV